MPRTKHVALLYLLSSCLHDQNVVTDWAKIDGGPGEWPQDFQRKPEW